MPYRANYPRTVAEILNPRMKFKPAALAAVRAFARSRPYRQDDARRETLVRRLNRELARAYAIPTPRLVFLWSDGSSGSSTYTPATHTITLRGRFSVVTFLHEFGPARGFDERQAVRFSVNLFARCFPRSFARCRQVGHTLQIERN